MHRAKAAVLMRGHAYYEMSARGAERWAMPPERSGLSTAARVGKKSPLDIRWKLKDCSLDTRWEPLIMQKTELLQGTLDMLILKVLNRGPMHGFGIAERIQQLSQDVLTVGEGSLYPGLYRLQDRGWIQSEWGQSENNRRAKYYSLTRSGRKQLDTEASDWEQMCAAIARIMESA
jgi:PadR family transcriptional regulator PadR